jgi:hypothetical protein
MRFKPEGGRAKLTSRVALEAYNGSYKFIGLG